MPLLSKSRLAKVFPPSIADRLIEQQASRTTSRRTDQGEQRNSGKNERQVTFSAITPTTRFEQSEEGTDRCRPLTLSSRPPLPHSRLCRRQIRINKCSTFDVQTPDLRPGLPCDTRQRQASPCNGHEAQVSPFDGRQGHIPPDRAHNIQRSKSVEHGVTSQGSRDHDELARPVTALSLVSLVSLANDEIDHTTSSSSRRQADTENPAAQTAVNSSRNGTAELLHVIESLPSDVIESLPRDVIERLPHDIIERLPINIIQRLSLDIVSIGKEKRHVEPFLTDGFTEIAVSDALNMRSTVFGSTHKFSSNDIGLFQGHSPTLKHRPSCRTHIGKDVGHIPVTKTSRLKTIVTRGEEEKKITNLTTPRCPGQAVAAACEAYAAADADAYIAPASTNLNRIIHSNKFYLAIGPHNSRNSFENRSTSLTDCRSQVTSSTDSPPSDISAHPTVKLSSDTPVIDTSPPNTGDMPTRRRSLPESLNTNRAKAASAGRNTRSALKSIATAKALSISLSSGHASAATATHAAENNRSTSSRKLAFIFEQANEEFSRNIAAGPTLVTMSMTSPAGQSFVRHSPRSALSLDNVDLWDDCDDGEEKKDNEDGRVDEHSPRQDDADVDDGRQRKINGILRELKSFHNPGSLRKFSRCSLVRSTRQHATPDGDTSSLNPDTHETAELGSNNDTHHLGSATTPNQISNLTAGRGSNHKRTASCSGILNSFSQSTVSHPMFNYCSRRGDVVPYIKDLRRQSMINLKNKTDRDDLICNAERMTSSSLTQLSEMTLSPLSCDVIDDRGLAGYVQYGQMVCGEKEKAIAGVDVLEKHSGRRCGIGDLVKAVDEHENHVLECCSRLDGLGERQDLLSTDFVSSVWTED